MSVRGAMAGLMVYPEANRTSSNASKLKGSAMAMWRSRTSIEIGTIRCFRETFSGISSIACGSTGVLGGGVGGVPSVRGGGRGGSPPGLPAPPTYIGKPGGNLRVKPGPHGGIQPYVSRDRKWRVVADYDAPVATGRWYTSGSRTCWISFTPGGASTAAKSSTRWWHGTGRRKRSIRTEPRGEIAPASKIQE